MRRDTVDSRLELHTTPAPGLRGSMLMLSLFAAGCVADIYADSLEEFPKDSGSGSTASTGELPTTEGQTPTEPGVQTLTGEMETDPVDPGDNKPPMITLFDVIPDHLSEAGPAELQLIASRDVVEVVLSLDDEELATVTLADFPRMWEALSAKDNGVARIFEVVVADAEGLTASAETTLTVDLPPSGSEKCIFEAPDKGEVTSVISAIEYTKDAIYPLGTRDDGSGLRLSVWKLDPNDCSLAPGWPKSLANWSANGALENQTSSGTTIDVDPDGNLLVGGNFMLLGGLTQSYVALLDASGALRWEQVGLIGDEVFGVAAAGSGRATAGGSRRTSNNPVRTDGAVWNYQATDGKVVVGLPTILKAPFLDGEEGDPGQVLSEVVWAVEIDPVTGETVAVGERELKDNKQPLNRMFAVKVRASGGIVGHPWTSGGPALGHDAARSVSVCGDKFVAGGWTRDILDPNAKSEPMLFWIDADGTSTSHRHFSEFGAAQVNGVACDRELKIVHAVQTLVGESDARVFAVQNQLDPPLTYEDGVVGADAAGAVACDPRGFCAAGGFRSAGGKPFAVVRVFAP